MFEANMAYCVGPTFSMGQIYQGYAYWEGIILVDQGEHHKKFLDVEKISKIPRSGKAVSEDRDW